MYPLVRELAADGIPVAVTCRVLKIARQPYYRWLDRAGHRRRAGRGATWPTRCSTPTATTPSSATGSSPTRPARPATTMCRPDGVADLPGQRLVVGVRQAEGLQEGQARRPGPRRPGPPRLHRRRPRTSCGWPTSPNTRPREGKLYCCAIKDVFSNRIVGWSIDSTDEGPPRRRRASRWPSPAAADVAGCILHSDRGSQFRSRKVQRALTRHGMVGSMGQVGSAGDNAAMESLLRPPATQRPRPPPLGHPRRAPHRHRHLDRTDLPPPPHARPPSAD